MCGPTGPRPRRLATRALIVLAVLHLFAARSLFSRSSSPHGRRSPQRHADHWNDVTDTSNDVTIIITSSWVPSHPSLELIRRTIDSFHYLEGLNVNTTPILITVDGAEYKIDRGSPTSKSRILSHYIQNLRKAYREWTNVRVLPQEVRWNLVGNVQQAIQTVETEYVYVIQHDMPFISPIHHSALIRTTEQIDDVRLVRFSPRRTLIRGRDKRGLCGDQIDVEANGIALAKTHTWSDNNHLTRKAYYEEMFSTIDGWDDVRYMETIMNPLGAQNCSYWGTYLYGKQGQGPPTIVHLDGRHSGLQEMKNR